jgi:GTP cyclohydrolase II
MTIRRVVSSRLPTPWAVFDVHGFLDTETSKEHLALSLGDISVDPSPLCRIHSECLTGDALFSLRCDCGAQLEAALKMIASEGRGVLLYLRQEGRGIGLLNKLKAYELQDHGADTVEANERLGFAPDLRRFDIAADMLTQLGVTAVRLMTNNPRKINALTDRGIHVVDRVPIAIARNPHNERYLATKASKLGHLFGEGLPDGKP